jgi:hypothetical protein
MLKENYIGDILLNWSIWERWMDDIGILNGIFNFKLM